MPGFDAPASLASPAFVKERKTRLPGWRAILVREETFLRLQSIQASTIDPHLDLRYLGDASMRTQQDLTAAKFTQSEETPGEARQVNFATLPLQDAVKVVKGDGSRLLAVFSDPRCPYCKALDEELAKLDNVTVYTFLLPWLGPESRPAAEALWAGAMRLRIDEFKVQR